MMPLGRKYPGVGVKARLENGKRVGRGVRRGKKGGKKR
jgi:hypothetical protein